MRPACPNRPFGLVFASLTATATPASLLALLASAHDLACLRLGPTQWLVGRGPFQRATAVSPAQTAFYINTFDLSDPRPWRIPAETWEIDEPTVAPTLDPLTVPLTWQPPDRASFEAVFQEIVDGLCAQRWQKAVPAVPESAAFAPADLPRLWRHWAEHLLAQSGSGLHQPFFFRENGCGFAGLSPETLFTLHGRTLRTMALAGTARPAEMETFAHDAKQIREHEMVVAMLRDQLSAWGRLTLHPREVLDLGGLIHFLTRFEVELTQPLAAEDIIRSLHPTPALGILPRTPGNLATLHHWRRRLGTPAHFAAPFGVQWQGSLHIAAAIRGVWWNNEHLWLPAGCGLVEGSELDHEWRELSLKRHWVKQALGLV